MCTSTYAIMTLNTTEIALIVGLLVLFFTIGLVYYLIVSRIEKWGERVRTRAAYFDSLSEDKQNELARA